MPILMKKGDFAAYRKVGPSAVSNWAKKNLIVYAADPARPGKQLVDVEKSELLINGTVDPTRGRPTKAAQTASAPEGGEPLPAVKSAIPLNGLEALRMEDMRERTLSRRLENEKAVGRLVDVAEAERRAGDLGRLIRERTNGVIRQFAERLAAETDPRSIVSILNGAFDDLFNQVSDEVEAAVVEEQVADAALEQFAGDEEGDDSDTGEPAAA